MNILIKLIVLLLIVGYLRPTQINAQVVPQIIITWQAYNYYPSDYPGKAPATPYGQFLVSVEVIEKNVILDLSKAAITWFVDGRFTNQGIGLKQIPISITKVTGENYSIKVSIKSNDKTIEGVKQIPIKTPELVLANPFPNNVVLSGENLLFEAVPYFFNIKSLEDLTFSWKVNNENAQQFQGNQILVNFETAQAAIDNTLKLDVFVQNRSNPLELKNSSLKLIVINP